MKRTIKKLKKDLIERNINFKESENFILINSEHTLKEILNILKKYDKLRVI